MSVNLLDVIAANNNNPTKTTSQQEICLDEGVVVVSMQTALDVLEVCIREV